MGRVDRPDADERRGAAAIWRLRPCRPAPHAAPPSTSGSPTPAWSPSPTACSCCAPTRTDRHPTRDAGGLVRQSAGAVSRAWPRASPLGRRVARSQPTERMARQQRLHDRALHADPAAVDQPDLGEAPGLGRSSRYSSTTDDDVAWLEGVKVEGVLDRDADGSVVAQRPATGAGPSARAAASGRSSRDPPPRACTVRTWRRARRTATSTTVTFSACAVSATFCVTIWRTNGIGMRPSRWSTSSVQRMRVPGKHGPSATRRPDPPDARRSPARAAAAAARRSRSPRPGSPPWPGRGPSADRSSLPSTAAEQVLEPRQARLERGHAFIERLIAHHAPRSRRRRAVGMVIRAQAAAVCQSVRR